ncbi:MAG: cysteine hydrolase [Olsenella sp.]|jgi:nicotinamidase-related amidase|nr:cysteine hydrolase [Olsenella sp.]MCI1793310.1 cysteine hydrolase [Olsenella sp.]MCI1810352.1 cysteine hydrolase [Olsenella sp.]MCI1878772.1 cysteine hydrolase [Olsenella sp.]
MNISAASTALLVIDVLVTDTSDAVYAPNPEEEALVANAAQLTHAAREAGMPVVFLCDQHIPGVDRELELWGEHGVKGKAHPHPALMAGSSPRDFVIPKRRYSGFFQTDLDLTLRELGVKTVIAVGEDTNICVLHTLADAWNLGYGSIVVSDATRTFLVGTQDGALEHMKRCFGTEVATTEQVISALPNAAEKC